MNKNIQILYPFKNSKTFKKITPMMCVLSQDHPYYIYQQKDLILTDPFDKSFKPLILMKNVQLPTETQTERFHQLTSLLKGIRYKLILTNQNQYLCIGNTDHTHSLVLFTIELNTRGYYEITQMEDVLKNNSF